MILAVSGGFRTTVGGLRISARSPLPIAFLAFINVTMWLSWARRARAIASRSQLVWDGIERHSTRLVIAIAVTSAIVAAIFSTRSAAGADASGYLSQAELWARNRWFIDDPLQLDLNDAVGWLTTPLGWLPTGGGDAGADLSAGIAVADGDTPRDGGRQWGDLPS